MSQSDSRAVGLHDLCSRRQPQKGKTNRLEMSLPAAPNVQPYNRAATHCSGRNNLHTLKCHNRIPAP